MKLENKNHTVRDIIVVGFALFAMFFGAGNVIFPPYLGVEAGPDWIKGFSAYFIADIGLAMLTVFALLRVGSSEAVTARLGRIPAAVLMSALIPILSLLFLIPSLIYGFKVGTFKSERDVVGQIYKSFGSLASVFAVAITAGQFMKWFGKTNLDKILAFKGAAALSKLNINYVVLLLIFIFITALLNIFMNSATAKWYVFALLLS